VIEPSAASPFKGKYETLSKLISFGSSKPQNFVDRKLRPGEAKTKVAFYSFSSGTTGKPKVSSPNLLLTREINSPAGRRDPPLRGHCKHSPDRSSPWYNRPLTGKETCQPRRCRCCGPSVLPHLWPRCCSALHVVFGPFACSDPQIQLYRILGKYRQIPNHTSLVRCFAFLPVRCS
jgi:hypothetical protein